jgi:hypothetical protein
LLFVALWNDGVDMGHRGCSTGASPGIPVHWQRKDHQWRGAQHLVVPMPTARSGLRSWAKASGSIGTKSRGDIHVIDITDPTAPKEVAFYRAGAGTTTSRSTRRTVCVAAYC